MTPEEFSEMIFKQDSNFGDWLYVIDKYTAWHPEYKPKLKAFAFFLKNKWSQFLNSWLVERDSLPRDKSSPRIDSWYKLLIDWINYASTLGYPKKDYQPQIAGDFPMREYIDHKELSKFRELCSISLLVDEDGVNPILCVSIDWKGSKYRRCVELGTLVRHLADGIREYHDKLLHAHAIDEISGRKRRKHPKRRGGSAGRLPTRRGRGTSMDATDYPSEQEQPFNYPITPQHEMTLDDMRQGYGARDWSHEYDPSGFSDVEGYQVLPPGEDPLQVQGWYDSIVNTARHLAESKAVKTLYADLKRTAKSKEFQKLALTEVFGPAAGPMVDAAYKVHDIVVQARDGNLHAQAKLETLRLSAEAGNEAANLTMDTASNINDKLNDKEASQEDHEEESSDFVQGWLYNRPYRSTTDVLTAPLRGEFPSIGLFARQAWHDGLEFAATMKRKPLFKLGA